MIIAKKIDLQDKNERQKYSHKLKEFEKEFTYPLGNKSFYISHGENSDYFSFFEKLGTPEFLILEDNDNLIGVICLVLRVINGKKTWYACDFKISREYRGKKLYRKWIWKFFVPFYLKCQNLFGINMSSPEKNKIWKHTQNIFKIFSINVKPCYLYEFSAKNFSSSAKNLLLNHCLVTNNGVKDIVVNEKAVILYHLVSTDHTDNLLHHKTVSLKDINLEDSVMLLSSSKMDLPFAKESVISLIHRSNWNLSISSAEI